MSAVARWLCLTWLAVLALPPAATAQFRSGSVLVVVYTKDGVAMAADSRVSGENFEQTDDACKISAPGNRILFGSTGLVASTTKYSGATSGTDHVNFSSSDEARSLVQNNPGYESLRSLAYLWAEAMKRDLETVPAAELERTASYTQGGGNLVCSVFAGANQAGELTVVKANLKYQGSTGGHPRIGSEVETVRLTKSIAIITCGYDAVVGEYVSSRSQPTVHEREEWKSYTEDKESKMAIRLVELTITFQEPKHVDGRSIIDVGGAVDAVELKHGGEIEWIQRKPNCAADQRRESVTVALCSASG